MSRGSKPVFASLLSLSLLIASSLLGAGCGGGGSSDSTGGTGSLTVTLTDSPAHDVSRFTVDITAITLTSTEASVVNGLKHAITLDLATLTRTSQVLSIQGIDGGHYTAASITFDFTNSSCFLVDQTTEATLFNDDGGALTTVTLPIDLSAMPILVSNGGHYELELDFDLDQSLTIDPVANSVNVAPSVVVRTNRKDAHVNLAMGALSSVDVVHGFAVMELQTPKGGFSLGSAGLGFNSSTVFQVDGVPAVGSTGVQLLPSVLGKSIQVFIAVDPANNSAPIAYVEAGKGTFNGAQDMIEGVIVDRGDNLGFKQFTVHGRCTSAAHDPAKELFNTDFQVTTKPGGPGFGTRIVSDSSPTNFTIDALNIGQRVQAFGALNFITLTMDATATSAIVRAEPTSLFAIANSAVAANSLEVDLVVPAPFARVEEIEVVTTSTPFAWGADNFPIVRDANHFKVSVGSLGTGLQIGAGDPVRMEVNFSGVNQQPPDAAAFTLAKLSPTTTLLSLRDRDLGMTLDTQVNGAQIVFTLSGTLDAKETAKLDHGLLGSDDLLPTTTQVTVGAGATAVFYCLQDVTAGTVKSFPTFAAFKTAFEAALAGGTTVVKDFIAAGSFGSGTLSATTVTAIVQ